MKKKWLINVFALIIFLGVIIYFSYQNYRLGEREEREEHLAAVVFDLVEIESFSKEDIKEIKVFRQDAGVYPFYYNISVKLNNGKELSYEWANKEKSSLTVSRNGKVED